MIGIKQMAYHRAPLVRTMMHIHHLSATTSSNNSIESNVHPGVTTFSPDAYSRGRPSYSAEALAIIIEEIERYQKQHNQEKREELLRITECGAGNGKFTRSLLDALAQKPTLRCSITATEPLSDMIESFKKNVSEVPIYQAFAASLPFQSSSIDVISCAQSFHWMAGDRGSLREFRRVLKPHGRVILIWNAMDESISWIRRLVEIIDACYDPNVPRYKSMAWQKAFDLDNVQPSWQLLRHTVLPNAFVQRGPEQLVIDRVASISVIASRSATARANVLDAVRTLLRSDPATKDSREFEIPYNTSVYVYEKLA